MGRIPVRMKKAHGDRSHPVGNQLLDCPSCGIFVERDEYVSIAVDPLRRLLAPAAGHNGLGELRGDVIDVVTHLAGDLDEVGKALRGQESGRCALAFDDQVAHHGRRAGNHLLNFVAGDAFAFDYVRKAVDDSSGYCVGPRQALRHMDFAVGAGHDNVGERSADVEAETVSRTIDRRHPVVHAEICVAPLSRYTDTPFTKPSEPLDFQGERSLEFNVKASQGRDQICVANM